MELDLSGALRLVRVESVRGESYFKVEKFLGNLHQTLPTLLGFIPKIPLMLTFMWLV